MSYLCQKCKKKLRVTDFVSEIKRVENYPEFEKSGLRNLAWSTEVYSYKYRS